MKQYEMEKLRPVFSCNLKQALKKQGKSQTWLADRMGVSTANVSAWCRGTKFPRENTLCTIATILQVTPAELLAEQETTDFNADFTTVQYVNMVKPQKSYNNICRENARKSGYALKGIILKYGQLTREDKEFLLDFILQDIRGMEEKKEGEEK